MSLTEFLIAEIEREDESTRKILERVPADKFEWRPHEKSMTIKALATHIANLAGMAGLVVSTDYVDFGEGKIARPVINTTDDLLNALHNGTKQSVEALKNAKDEDLSKNWMLKHGEHIILESPKGKAIRSVALNHLIHHRGQLSVYLRLLNIPVPGIYGPSADDKK